jgi:hypothetical protein
MSNSTPPLLTPHSPASVVKLLADIREDPIISMCLVMRLEIPDAADMFDIGVTVGSCCERAVASDPSHPLVQTAINLPPF